MGWTNVTGKCSGFSMPDLEKEVATEFVEVLSMKSHLFCDLWLRKYNVINLMKIITLFLTANYNQEKLHDMLARAQITHEQNNLATQLQNKV